MPSAINDITTFSSSVIGVMGMLNVDPRQAHGIVVFLINALVMPIFWLDMTTSVITLIGSNHNCAR